MLIRLVLLVPVAWLCALLVFTASNNSGGGTGSNSIVDTDESSVRNGRDVDSGGGDRKNDNKVIQVRRTAGARTELPVVYRVSGRRSRLK